jgi:hypothetical protein
MLRRCRQTTGKIRLPAGQRKRQLVNSAIFPVKAGTGRRRKFIFKPPTGSGHISYSLHDSLIIPVILG